MPDRHEWERPGAHAAAPGVHRIPLPLPNDGLKAVNVYAISDGDDVVLVDAGWALSASRELLAAGLDQIGYGLHDVREYLVTHAHRDHYTQAVALRRDFGGSVALGEGERGALSAIRNLAGRPALSRLNQAGAAEVARQLAGIAHDLDVNDWEDPDRWLTDALDLPLRTRTLRVIATPGHTSGHVVFHDPQGDLLFAGDHVLPHITPSIGVEPNRPVSPLRDYLSSLALVRALPDARLLPAHGPVTDSVHDRVEELLRHHARRLDETAAAVAAGAHTGYEVATALTWTRRKRTLADLDLFNVALAIEETMAHLRVLVDTGRLSETTTDGVDHFLAA